MAIIATKCAMNAELYSLRDFSILLGACSRAHYVPEEVLLPLQLRLGAAVGAMEPQDAAAHVTEIASHLSRLRVKAPRLWETLGSAALACLPHASFADVAGLLAAHARANVASPQLFGEGLDRAVGKMGGAAPQDVATLMWAVARSNEGCHCPRLLVRSLASHLAGRADAYDVLQLATLAGACAKLGVKDGGLRRRLAARACEALREEAAALANVAALAPPLRQRPDGSAAARPVTSQAVSVLLGGLASMGLADRTVLREATALLIDMVNLAAATGAEAAGSDGGGMVAAVQREDVERVAEVLRRAGAEEEREALMQACAIGGGLGVNGAAERQ